MRYQAVDLVHQSMHAMATGLGVISQVVSADINPLAKTRLGRIHSAALETSIRLLQHYPKQGWAFEDVNIKGKPTQ